MLIASKLIKLTSVPFSVRRSIAGRSVDLTEINGRLHMTMKQLKLILGTNQTNIKRYIQDIEAQYLYDERMANYEDDPEDDLDDYTIQFVWDPDNGTPIPDMEPDPVLDGLIAAVEKKNAEKANNGGAVLPPHYSYVPGDEIGEGLRDSQSHPGPVTDTGADVVNPQQKLSSSGDNLGGLTPTPPQDSSVSGDEIGEGLRDSQSHPGPVTDTGADVVNPQQKLSSSGDNLGGSHTEPHQDLSGIQNVSNRNYLPSIEELTVYTVNIAYSRNASTESQHGGGGGLQNQKFYSIELFLLIVERMANTPRKAAIMNEVREIAATYYNKGIVINQQVIENMRPDAGPTVVAEQPPEQEVAAFDPKRPHTFNYTRLRHDMADENNELDKLIQKCNDITLPDGRLNTVLVHRCRAMMHNTAHVSIHGMTATQLVYARNNPDDPFFGQLTFAGLNAPRSNELKNACNFMHGDELYSRTYQLRTAIGRIMMHIRENGRISTSEMLRMFTMHCMSKHIRYAGWDWTQYPETAIHTVVNMPDNRYLKSSIREAVNLYKANFPNRHQLSAVAKEALDGIERHLCEICANGEEIYRK